MKKVINILVTIALLSSCGSTGDEVWICTGRSSKCYHATQSCMGLSNCGGNIKEVSLEEAEDMGRRPCRICY